VFGEADRYSQVLEGLVLEAGNYERMAREAPPRLKPAPARKRLSGEQRRASIIDAATGVFAERGYEAARIEEIAAAAGVSKALIYEHFPGKRELYAEIATAGTEEALARIRAAGQPGLESARVLEAALGAFLDFVAERPDIWRVITQDVNDPAIVALEHRLHRQAVAAIAELVAAQRSLEGRQLEARELEQVAEMMNGAILAMLNWWIENPTVSRDEVSGNLLSFLWLGLERTREGERFAGSSGSGATLGTG
jgi:AcrR family transcriptional regulator